MLVLARQAERLAENRYSIDRRGSLAFVFCVEPGWLEAQACLLSESIRRFGGTLADGPIYAVQPRGTQATLHAWRAIRPALSRSIPRRRERVSVAPKRRSIMDTMDGNVL